MSQTRMSEFLLRLFPVPRYLAMPAFGLDISDHSVKFIELVRAHGSLMLGRYGSRNLPAGAVVGGKIMRPDDLVGVLRKLKRDIGMTFVRASLPEEPGYIFETQVPRVRPNEIRGLLQFKLEENVPLGPTEAVFDYDVVPASQDHTTLDLVVSVFPQTISDEYATLLQTAGLTPLSLEIEAQAIARALVPAESVETVLIVDIGRTRSGMSIVRDGIVRFTTTVEIGGDGISHAIRQQHPQATEAEITSIKNEQGCLRSSPNDPLYPLVMEQVTKLAEEIERYLVYWKTHATDMHSLAGEITRVILSGGNASLAGIPEYLTTRLKLPTERGNVWTNVLSLEKVIPDIPFNESLTYASAIGLALHTG